MFIRPAPCLLSPAATRETLDEALGKAFVDACEARGYVGAAFTLGDRSLIQSTVDAVSAATDAELSNREGDQDGLIPGGRAPEPVLSSLLAIQSRACRRLMTGVFSVSGCMPRNGVTEAEAVRIVEAGVQGLTIDARPALPLTLLTLMPVASALALSDFRFLLYSLDVERAAMERCYDLDPHEKTAGREGYREQALANFAETYPDGFVAARRQLFETLELLQGRAEEWLFEHRAVSRA